MHRHASSVQACVCNILHAAEGFVLHNGCVVRKVHVAVWDSYFLIL